MRAKKILNSCLSVLLAVVVAFTGISMEVNATSLPYDTYNYNYF